MQATLSQLEAALGEGLHLDNLERLIDICESALREGRQLVPLFVLRESLVVLRDRKSETTVVASAVESVDASVTAAAIRLVGRLAGGADTEPWEEMEELVRFVVDLPATYPGGQ